MMKLDGGGDEQPPSWPLRSFYPRGLVRGGGVNEWAVSSRFINRHSRCERNLFTATPFIKQRLCLLFITYQSTCKQRPHEPLDDRHSTLRCSSLRYRQTFSNNLQLFKGDPSFCCVDRTVLLLRFPSILRLLSFILVVKF